MSGVTNKNIRWSISLTDYWFGDSWVYGDELAHPETECFASLVSKSNYVNMGENATSIDWMVLEKLTRNKWMDFSILGISTQDGSLIKKVITFSSLIYIATSYF